MRRGNLLLQRNGIAALAPILRPRPTGVVAIDLPPPENLRIAAMQSRIAVDHKNHPKEGPPATEAAVSKRI